MKKYVLPLALVTAVGITACDEQASTPEAESGDSAAVTLETTDQRLSYGIAYGFGKRLAQDGVPTDLDAFTAGLRDGLEGQEAQLSEEEIRAELQAYQQQAQAEAQAARDVAAEENLAAGNLFLAENGKRDGVVTTESGLQYEVLEEGDGEVPGEEDTVEVNYRGTLIDGTEFDSSYKRGQSVQFGVGQVISGWTEALQMMPVGSKWKLFIPSDLAYGAGGAGSAIGPNAALVFEVELLNIVSPEAAGDEAGEDAAG